MAYYGMIILMVALIVSLFIGITNSGVALWMRVAGIIISVLLVEKLIVLLSGNGIRNSTQIVSAAPESTRMVEERLPHGALQAVGG